MALDKCNAERNLARMRRLARSNGYARGEDVLCPHCGQGGVITALASAARGEGYDVLYHQCGRCGCLFRLRFERQAGGGYNWWPPVRYESVEVMETHGQYQGGA